MMISCQNQGKTDMHTQKAFDRQTVLADTGERERTTNANIPYHLVQYQTMGNYMMGLPFSDPAWFPGIPGMPYYDFRKTGEDMPLVTSGQMQSLESSGQYPNVNNLL